MNKKNENIQIKEVTEEDSNLLRMLAQQNRPLDVHTPYTYWVISKLFADCSFILLDNEQQPMGYLTAVYNRDVFFIWQIAINKEYRGNNYSQLLIDAAIRRARELSLNAMVTIASDNQASMAAFSGYCEKQCLRMHEINEKMGDLDDSACGEVVYMIDIV